jgi:demethylmenaquinone methyltransferase/2-methoxy-6-polyprenyl-1,4-benzoquinol methylase
VTRDERRLLDEQIAYYRARAPEYDDWFFRRGRYDRGAEHWDAWFSEVARVEAALERARPAGAVLELACGTGLWTRHLVRTAASVTAVDASPEVLERNAARVGAPNVRYVSADLFEWEPRELFDFVFFGFWLSHVPPEQFEPFWSRLRAALRPEGTVFFVDNARNPAIAASDHELPDEASITMERRLNDGRRFRIVKVFYEPEVLEERLRRLGWSGSVRSTGEFFVYGSVR